MVFVPPPKTGAIQIRIHLYINICLYVYILYQYIFLLQLLGLRKRHFIRIKSL